ncbi:DUF3558 domain-containing protein [Lentzea sp. NPDC051838]|uniref:DUF3558 domain-containing protein n=1 Tax=Lentzea sp. NPDC051838 TaxID=3154849 RepID=UPI00344A31C3
MKRILIATLIGLSAFTAACTGTTGSPTPSPTGGGTPTSDSNTSSGLKSVKPCDLLTDAEATSFSFKLPGEEGTIIDAATCDWTVSGNGGLQVAVNATDGVKDLNLSTGKRSDVKVGKFAGIKIEAPDGSKDTCDVVISVSETSSVLVVATATAGSGDTATACERASKAADLIAPKLP